MKKKRITEASEITSMTNQEAPNTTIPVSHYTIGDFVHKGKKKATEVHLVIYMKNNPVPLSIRFKSRQALEDLIVELDSARTRVFGKQEDQED